MRSRAQTIAIILSKYKKKFGTSFSQITKYKETKAEAAIRRTRDRMDAQHRHQDESYRNHPEKKAEQLAALEKQDAEIRERKRARDAGEVLPENRKSQANDDLARVQKHAPYAKIVSAIAGASVVYPDGSILKLPYLHDQFIDHDTHGSLHKTLEERGAVQARLWDGHGGELAITIHTPTITAAQARVITDASRSATDTIWDQVPIEGFNKRKLGISGASKKAGEVAAALANIVSDPAQQSMSFASKSRPVTQLYDDDDAQFPINQAPQAAPKMPPLHASGAAQASLPPKGGKWTPRIIPKTHTDYPGMFEDKTVKIGAKFASKTRLRKRLKAIAR